MKVNKNQELYSPKRIAILTLIVMVPLFLFGCTSEKDKQIADLTKKVEEQSKQVEALSKQKEQDIAKQDMALQEECSKGASQYANRLDYGNDVSISYTNHYSKKLNKCFIKVVSNFNKDSAFSEGLYDINENKRYGVLLKTHNDINCVVNDTQCNSVSQWESLVKPYMEE